MSHVKNYNVGQIQLDLPTSNYFHELPLLTFGDIHGNMNLSLIFNYVMKVRSSNPFNVTDGFKLNVHKRIIMSNGVPSKFQNENGKEITLTGTNSVYTFDDESQRILRYNNSMYELENADYSKEVYTSDGKITAVYDKYGVVILSYVYDTAGKLTYVTYRNSKTISFAYDAYSRITSITYGNSTTTLAYTSSGITVNHYSGTMIDLTIDRKSVG